MSGLTVSDVAHVTDLPRSTIRAIRRLVPDADLWTIQRCILHMLLRYGHGTRFDQCMDMIAMRSSEMERFDTAYRLFGSEAAPFARAARNWEGGAT